MVKRLLQTFPVLFLALVLGGCAQKPPDPGASRTEMQTKALRDRMLVTQART